MNARGADSESKTLIGWCTYPFWISRHSVTRVGWSGAESFLVKAKASRALKLPWTLPKYIGKISYQISARLIIHHDLQALLSQLDLLVSHLLVQPHGTDNPRLSRWSHFRERCVMNGGGIQFEPEGVGFCGKWLFNRQFRRHNVGRLISGAPLNYE